MAEKLFLRGLERSDFPIIIDWLRSKDALNNYTFLMTLLTKEQLKDTLIKGLSLSLMNYTRKLYLVSEMKNKGIIAFHLLEDIDWRSRTASFQSYFVKEIRNTKIEKDINKQLADYFFKYLQLRKIYYYTKFENLFPSLKPEVIFLKHLQIPNDTLNMQVYGFSHKSFADNF